MTARGRLIALEGGDGSGKSTHARLLAGALGAALTSEPGATALGGVLRHLLLDPSLPPVSARAEALLMAADRAEHVAEVVGPALDAGHWVVTDRFSGSTLAYQGYGRGIALADLRRLVQWAAGGIEADLTVVIDVPVPEARARRDADTDDRLERLDTDFHERVRAGYLALAAAGGDAWAVVDGTGTVDDVAVRCAGGGDDGPAWGAAGVVGEPRRPVNAPPPARTATGGDVDRRHCAPRGRPVRRRGGTAGPRRWQALRRSQPVVPCTPTWWWDRPASASAPWLRGFTGPPFCAPTGDAGTARCAGGRRAVCTPTWWRSSASARS